jgi:hypothetical protein
VGAKFRGESDESGYTYCIVQKNKRIIKELMDNNDSSLFNATISVPGRQVFTIKEYAVFIHSSKQSIKSNGVIMSACTLSLSRKR